MREGAATGQVSPDDVGKGSALGALGAPLGVMVETSVPAEPLGTVTRNERCCICSGGCKSRLLRQRKHFFNAVN